MIDRWPDPPADAPLPKANDPPGRAKPTLKRYTWSRLHHDLPTMDLWPLVAEMAGSERARVEAFVWRLEIYASTNRPRGSLDGFNIKALAAAWRVPAEELVRIYEALGDADVGWIEDDVIVTFWDRNPDSDDDPTAAGRSKRSRKRRKIKLALAARGASLSEVLDELERQGVGYPNVATTVTRDGVTVTPRADQIKTESGTSTPPPPHTAAARLAAEEQDTAGYQDADSAEVWLAFHGKRILVERMQESRARAEQRMARWRAQLGGSPIALAFIIDQVSASDFITAKFMVAITEAIKRWQRDANGPQLPLPPVMQQGRRAGYG